MLRAQPPSSRTDATETQAVVKVPPKDTRIEVRRIRFEGVRAIDETEARDTLKTRQSSCRLILLAPLCRFTPTLFLVNKKYLDRETVAEDATRLQVLYWRHGYREAQVDTVIVQRPGHRTATVTFRIREGPPTTLRAIEAVYGSPVRHQRDGHAFDVRVGAPFDVIALERAMLNLKNELWDEGYAEARVTAAVSRADSLTRSVSAVVTVEPGAPTRVGRIEVEGNHHASEATVRSALTLQPGDLFRRRDVMASQRYLFRSGLFERALIIMPQREEADDGSGRVVRVTVQEGPARRARAGVGFSTVDFLQTSAIFSHNDFLGGARRLDVRGAVTNLLAGSLDGRGPFRDLTPPGVAGDERQRFLAPMWQAGATITQPWLGSPKNGLSVSAFAHRRSAAGVFVDRGAGGEMTFARELAARVTAGASYRAERTRVDAADAYFCGGYGACEAGAAAALRAPAWLAPAAVALMVDRADDPDFPTAGYSGRLAGEAAAPGMGSD
ncbi:MAG TPA: POTRA domain-containing protein, partial [Gemmatimonadaceae bacterium]|nr:POTRA domain-containing protein [Gemmatimonadaceae bacterium]